MSMGRWRAAVVVLAALVAAHVAVAADPAPQAAADTTIISDPGVLQAHGRIGDPDFGLQVRAIGLERSVRMRQWQRQAGAADGVVAVWSAELLPSVDGRHANPARFPLQGQRWWSQEVSWQGRPVNAQVLAAVAKNADDADLWTAVDPEPAQLPPNLAATFQSDGHGLTTSQDAAHPQVGDVQVRWRAIVSARAPAGLRWADGKWQMADAIASTPSAPASGAVTPAPVAPPVTASRSSNWNLRGLAALLVFAAVVGVMIALGRRKHRR